MSDHGRHPDDDSGLPPYGPVSREALTPRGGFMARPGLKQPPRHAVVVRVGDAPVTDEIPIARGSKPPPAPAWSEVSGPASDEKVTLRAIPSPTPRAPLAVPNTASAPPSPASPPPVIESVPPPSDMPVVASIRGSEAPPSRRPAWSGSTTVLAAAAGLVLGLGSVALNRWRSLDEAPVGVAGVQRGDLVVANAAPAVVAAPLASSAPAPSASVTPALQPPQPAAPRAPARRSIF